MNHDVMLFIQQLESTFDLKTRIKKEKVGDAELDHYDMTIAFFIVYFSSKIGNGNNV